MSGMQREFGRIRLEGRSSWVLRDGDDLLLLDGPPWESPSGSEAVGDRPFFWLPPIAPSKILALGRTYADHARERGFEPPREPLLFLKPPSSLLASGGNVVLPPESAQVEFEGELGLVIGRRVRRFPLDGDPAEVVLGALAADDVSARDFQKNDGQWARAKGFDTFCPVARFVREGIPPGTAMLRTFVNGAARQEAPLSQMSFPLARLLAHASMAMTLEPGDLLLTGTPAGVGRLAPGDRVRVEIDGLAALEHGVEAES